MYGLDSHGSAKCYDVKKILFNSKDVMGLFISYLGYQTTQIPTGFVYISVYIAISGGFCENVPNLTGLLC